MPVPVPMAPGGGREGEEESLGGGSWFGMGKSGLMCDVPWRDATDMEHMAVCQLGKSDGRLSSHRPSVRWQRELPD
jgi:hypothetical protein